MSTAASSRRSLHAVKRDVPWARRVGIVAAACLAILAAAPSAGAVDLLSGAPSASEPAADVTAAVTDVAPTVEIPPPVDASQPAAPVPAPALPAPGPVADAGPPAVAAPVVEQVLAATDTTQQVSAPPDAANPVAAVEKSVSRETESVATLVTAAAETARPAAVTDAVRDVGSTAGSLGTAPELVTALPVTALPVETSGAQAPRTGPAQTRPTAFKGAEIGYASGNATPPTSGPPPSPATDGAPVAESSAAPLLVADGAVGQRAAEGRSSAQTVSSDVGVLGVRTSMVPSPWWPSTVGFAAGGFWANSLSGAQPSTTSAEGHGAPQPPALPSAVSAAVSAAAGSGLEIPAAILAALLLVAPRLGRLLRPSPDLWRPLICISALDRPG